MADYGAELNARIKAAKKHAEDLYAALYRAESDLEDLRAERNEARNECKCCNDCSMCLG